MSHNHGAGRIPRRSRREIASILLSTVIAAAATGCSGGSGEDSLGTSEKWIDGTSGKHAQEMAPPRTDRAQHSTKAAQRKTGSQRDSEAKDPRGLSHKYGSDKAGVREKPLQVVTTSARVQRAALQHRVDRDAASIRSHAKAAQFQQEP